MTQYQGILEFSPERQEWRVFLPERANMKPLHGGTSARPSEATFEEAKQYLRESEFTLAFAGWQQDGERWTIAVKPW